MTVEQALIIDGFSNEEAKRQIKAGASLYSLPDYLESLKSCGAEDEELQQIETLAGMVNSRHQLESTGDGITFIYDAEASAVVVLEVCL